MIPLMFLSTYIHTLVSKDWEIRENVKSKFLRKLFIGFLVAELILFTILKYVTLSGISSYIGWIIILCILATIFKHRHLFIAFFVIAGMSIVLLFALIIYTLAFIKIDNCSFCLKETADTIIIFFVYFILMLATYIVAIIYITISYKQQEQPENPIGKDRKLIFDGILTVLGFILFAIGIVNDFTSSTACTLYIGYLLWHPLPIAFRYLGQKKKLEFSLQHIYYYLPISLQF